MKAYKYGVDSGGQIWVAGEAFQKYYNKKERLIKRHNENPNAMSDQVKKFTQPQLDVLEKYQEVSKHDLSGEERVLLHDIATDILKKQKRI